MGFPYSSAGKQSACNSRRPWFYSWAGEIHWRRDRLPTPVLLASLVAQVEKSPFVMRETRVRSLGWAIPGERLPTPVFWPGEFYGLSSPWGHLLSFQNLILVLQLDKTMPLFLENIC